MPLTMRIASFLATAIPSVYQCHRRALRSAGTFRQNFLQCTSVMSGLDRATSCKAVEEGASLAKRVGRTMSVTLPRSSGSSRPLSVGILFVACLFFLLLSWAVAYFWAHPSWLASPAGSFWPCCSQYQIIWGVDWQWVSDTQVAWSDKKIALKLDLDLLSLSFWSNFHQDIPTELYRAVLWCAFDLPFCKQSV